MTARRLDHFLHDQLPEFSRTSLQRFIRQGMILVNGQEVKPSLPLEGGEVIELEIDYNDSEQDEIVPEQVDFGIIHEDEHLVIIDKPAGLVVHPGRGNLSGTLANGLAHRYHDLSDINGPLRPGIIHRLDKDTSGLLIVAKTNHAHREIAAQFEQRTVNKTYQAMTWGRWEPVEGIIEKPIKRSGQNHLKYTVNNAGKPAVTEFRRLAEFRYLSQMEFHPRTGRTHQIRVHASHLGFAIFADELYNGGVKRAKGYLPEVNNILKHLLHSIKRHALHAHRLEINHPITGKRLVFSSPLPDDFNFLLKEIHLLNG